MCSSMERYIAAKWMFRGEVRRRKEVDWKAASMRREPLKCAT